MANLVDINCHFKYQPVITSSLVANNIMTFSKQLFRSPFYIQYTFITCPNHVVLPSSYWSIPCLSNSTSSFYATTSYKRGSSMFPSCQIVKRLRVPAIDRERLLLEMALARLQKL
ncbi:hypothetical protein YC2023_048195 [Brassica napus]